MRLKSFCTDKETINLVTRKSTEHERISARCTPNRRKKNSKNRPGLEEGVRRRRKRRRNRRQLRNILKILIILRN